MNLKAEAVILCDDIRQENNGKSFLIGVYGGGIGVPSLPLNFRSAWWIQVRGAKGLHKFKFRITGPHNAQLIAGEAEVNMAKDGFGIFSMTRLPIQLQSFGPIKFEWQLQGRSTWEVIKEIEVEQKPTTTSNVSAQPSAQSQTSS
jgi:hypothetical protein